MTNPPGPVDKPENGGNGQAQAEAGEERKTLD